MKTVKVHDIYDFGELCKLCGRTKFKLCSDIEAHLAINIYSNNIVIDGNGHTIDFCHEGCGIRIFGNNVTIKNLRVMLSSLNGIKIVGNHNKIINCSAFFNRKTGIQICDGGSYNKIINCESRDNDCGDGSADGFACKLHSGKGNKFIDCEASNNEDDGFDLFMADESVIIKNCKARNNFGSGFKLGGLKSCTDLKYGIKHTLIKCDAYDNNLYGFTSNNQVGEIILKKCYSGDNTKGNFFFPEISHPKALDFETLKLGKTYIKNCFYGGEYGGAPNNFEGAVIIHTLKESLKFFLKLL